MVNEAARLMSMNRWEHTRPVTLTCHECGEAFEAMHRHALSCSPRCRQRKKYRLMKQRKEAKE
jgi:hypothetical protein